MVLSTGLPFSPWQAAQTWACSSSVAASQGVGYREVLDHLAGRVRLEATIARVQARTRQFAKRQATWFRGLAEVRPWPVPTDEPPAATASRLAARIGIGFGIAAGPAN